MAMNNVDEPLRVVRRKVAVKGSGGVVCHGGCPVQRGKVWMSIQPPSKWESIMETVTVDELI